MEIKRGIAVSPGVVPGPALVLGTEDFRIPRRFVSVNVVDIEVARFRSAIDAVCTEISENERLASERLGAQYGAIFTAHLNLARDPKLREEIEELIRERTYAPEFASSRVLRRYAKLFQNLGNQYMAERAVDIFDLEKRLLRHLLGTEREELAHITEPVIVLATNLTPSETASLNPEFVLGFATEVGGHTSHTAILAGALEIPAVVGVGPFLSDVSGGDTIIIDGNHGEVIVDPDEPTLKRYRVTRDRIKTANQKLELLGQLESKTADGVPIKLYGNIEFPEEVDHCIKRGAEGVGLYRTEFLYLKDDREPSEEDHYNAYRRVVDPIPTLPVVIRTLDLGAEKFPHSLEDLAEVSPNPVLGLRSVRFTLRNLGLFKTQLRAILRAAVHGDIRIMFPLVTSVLELRQAKMILGDVMEDLEEEGIPFCRDIQVGMMVEVPSAALLADRFAEEVDFFSIGTNDLIQYTLAVDRANPTVADLYSAADPSILRLIRMVVAAAAKKDTPVVVCGQMSGDPLYTAVLIGMGIREMSATPFSLPIIKQVIRSITIPQAEEIAAHADTLDVARDVENYLRGELKKISPDEFS
ncbi:phosphoenolpyruvate--protein phosphotransferase [Symmachiella dynata]|uniref:phosphoenolpyruvate--protein phosphotransferase n=1 Tax=Symmachiella dynata TaxID=2527995 RepID=UPI0011AA12ED|nr:phosphoenolpyruvate--protein phosphotransferase [Symmachiella dynata]